MYAIVDIETTGGSAAWHRITEIAIVLHDGKRVTDRFQTLINPERPIPPGISMLTGITNEMVESAPTFDQVAAEVLKWTEDRIFVAHNVQFDFSFIKKELEQLGASFTRKKLCTVRLSRKLLPGLRSYSLGNLCGQIGISIQDRHRAMGDAEATATLFTRLLNIEHSQEVIKHSLKRSSGENAMPPHVPREMLEQLPEATGVYYFHDKNGKIIYVGKAANLRQRVGEHFSGNTHTKTKQHFLSNIHRVTHEVTGHELIALLLENESIKKHYPRYNRSNKAFNLISGLYAYEDQNGYMRMAVGHAGKHDKPLRMFKDHAEAIQFVLNKTREHNLCLRLCHLIESHLRCTYTDGEGHYCEVCHGKQEPEEYNALFHQAFAAEGAKGTFAIRTPGRVREEQAFVLVEKGRFLGFGFVSKEEEINGWEDLRHRIRYCYDTQDSQSIIQSYLKKARLLAREPFQVFE